ncbi:hypothetical protein ES332_D12G270200v1 [Gossypium tomentosum]|uniref:Tryptophan synthase beta chain-like PALP domain-containing protein n=1 Tax=Gossypium tomentosum TaxID=34277 RepID=A0A5D2IDV3_GOSTO|nr:hypothetical protein ES332_D12G270200v1 [Gossypium tomentosum]
MEVNKEKYAADLSIQEARSLCMLFLEGGCSSSVNVFKRGKGNHLLLVFILFSKLTLFYELLNRGVSIFRGARNAIFSLDDQQAVTHRRLLHSAKFRVWYGGQVIWSEPTMQSKEETATNVLQETGAALIHAHDDGRIISGQGTVSLELLEQAPHMDTKRVPISGSGLISGVALAAKSFNPAI